MVARWIVFLLVLAGVVWALVLLPYEVIVVALAIIGFLASLFVMVTWTPFVVLARFRDKARVSYLLVIDFAGLSYLGVIVLGTRLWMVAADGVIVPPDPVRRFIGFGVWLMIALVTSVRAYAWFRTLRAHPREELTRVVSDQMDRHSAG